ncbi:hypothetical protein N7456_002838 [Penicillium angulare]|uniref:Prion-inhibition and propagation HeLo domain-containing protein n=1 Tax=Penicillium angulare TaxID=116970 RepID=A0A9W9FTM9_9EURO|nr:hypothetical protein N7456_002838 [Penicillium angulare]
MEIAGLAFGVVGVVGLCDACLKLYDLVTVAQMYQEDREDFDIFLYYEKTRFSALKEEIEAMVKLSDLKLPDATSSEQSPPTTELSTSAASEEDVFGDGRLKFIERILRQLSLRLQEAVDLRSKYDAEVSAGSTRTKFKPFSRLSKKLRPLRWAMEDKSTLDAIIQKLRYLNHCLQQQIPQSSLPRLHLDFTAAQILAADPARLRCIQDSSMRAGYDFLSKAATVRLASYGHETGGKESRDFHILPSDVKALVTNKNELRYLTGHMQSTSMTVLIERRSGFQTATLPTTAAPRLNQLVRVLQSMYSLPGEATNSRLMDFGILQCIGWIIPENQDYDTIDLVFSYPSNINSEPISMHTYLRLRSENSLPRNLAVWNRPPLGARFKLAQSLVRLYANFISVGYVHRGISSHNILFFADDINKPHLAGVAEARPQSIEHQSSYLSTEYLDRELYWPWKTILRESSPKQDTESWSTATDLYGLGVVLVEVGLWRTAKHICGDCSMQDFHQTKLPQAVEKLDYHMGEIYRDVVKRCFTVEKEAHEIELHKHYSKMILEQLELCLG